MLITVNGKQLDFIENKSVFEYLKKLKYNPKRVVVEINGDIVKRINFENHIINAGDKIEIVCFVGGG